jgi:hypothetical protein
MRRSDPRAVTLVRVRCILEIPLVLYQRHDMRSCYSFKDKALENVADNYHDFFIRGFG